MVLGFKKTFLNHLGPKLRQQFSGKKIPVPNPEVFKNMVFDQKGDKTTYCRAFDVSS